MRLDGPCKSQYEKLLAWQTILGAPDVFHHRQCLVEFGGYEQSILAMDRVMILKEMPPLCVCTVSISSAELSRWAPNHGRQDQERTNDMEYSMVLYHCKPVCKPAVHFQSKQCG